MIFSRTKPKVACVVGTRPECIKMAPVIKALRKDGWCEVIVVNSGQHRDLVNQALAPFGINPEFNLDVMEPNQTLSGITSKVMSRFDEFLVNVKPDLVLVQGDTTTVLASALASFHRHVPIGHVEAGLRTNDMRNPFPEEMNRVVVGRISSLHFAPTEKSASNLLQEGVQKENIHLTGNTVIDALLEIASSTVSNSSQLCSGDLRTILLTVHRRENFGDPLNNIFAAVNAITSKFDDVEFIFPVHPNPNVTNSATIYFKDNPRVRMFQPLDYVDLVSVMKKAYIVLTDSGGIQEEAPALAKPVLVLRRETERPEAIDFGVAKLVGSDTDSIISEVSELLTNREYYAKFAKGASPYGDGEAAGRISELARQYIQTKNSSQLAE